MINEYALITGASSGIGLEISKCLAVRGYSLILVSRRKQKLDEIRNYLTNQFKVKVDIIAADLEDMKTPELIIVTVMVVGHIDTTYVTHSLHKGLILCQIEGILSSIASCRLN